jgi:hypothetical protein
MSQTGAPKSPYKPHQGSGKDGPPDPQRPAPSNPMEPTYTKPIPDSDTRAQLQHPPH